MVIYFKKDSINKRNYLDSGQTETEPDKPSSEMSGGNNPAIDFLGPGHLQE